MLRKYFLNYIDILGGLCYILIAENHTLNADVTGRSNPYFDTRAVFALLAAGRNLLPAVFHARKVHHTALLRSVQSIRKMIFRFYPHCGQAAPAAGVRG